MPNFHKVMDGYMVLRVKLEIVPFGDEANAREIGRLDIFNIGEAIGRKPMYEYGVIEMSPGEGGLHSTQVYHHRPDGAWALVRAAIEDCDIKGP